MDFANICAENIECLAQKFVIWNTPNIEKVEHLNTQGETQAAQSTIGWMVKYTKRIMSQWKSRENINIPLPF